MRLKDKVAIVTGAASGIGREIACTFITEGAKVVIADINRDGAETTAAAIGGAEKRALGIAVDVTNEVQVEAAVAKTIGVFGRIDVLVSNAGPDRGAVGPIRILQMEAASGDPSRRRLPNDAGGDPADVLTRDWRQHHLYGLRDSKEASVLKAPYVTAKHGLEGLAKVVAKEGAPHGVRANVICPGFVRTPLVDKQIPEQAKALGISQDAVIKDVMLKDTVDGKFTTTEHVAQVALFFASFDSNALTGQSLVVSHGWFMQ
jgi:3-hydroxybutyrate dehydrogenase